MELSKWPPLNIHNLPNSVNYSLLRQHILGESKDLYSQESDGHITIPGSNQQKNTEVIHMDTIDHSTYIVIITITQLKIKRGLHRHHKMQY